MSNEQFPEKKASEYQIEIVEIKSAPGSRPTMMTDIIGIKQWVSIGEDQAEKLTPYLREKMSLEEFRKLLIETDSPTSN